MRTSRFEEQRDHTNNDEGIWLDEGKDEMERKHDWGERKDGEEENR